MKFNMMKTKFYSRILIIFLVLSLILILDMTIAEESNPTGTPGTTNPTAPDTTNPATPATPSSSDVKMDDKGKIIPATIDINDKGRILTVGEKEFYAPKDSQVIVKPNEKTVQVVLPKDSQIKQEPVKKKKQREDEEERDISYQAKDFIQLPDDVAKQMGFAGKKIEFKGILNHNGNNWYVPSGQQIQLKIDGKESLLIKNIYGKLSNLNENINLYFKSTKLEGNYVYLGDKKFITGSTNNLDGHPVQFLEGNPYVNMPKNSHMAIQPLSNSEIRIENGKVLMKGGGIMNQDFSSYMLSSSKQQMFWKKGSGIMGIDSESIKDKSYVPGELLPFKKDGTPVSPKILKLSFDDKGMNIVPMTNEESRVFINKPSGIIPVTPQPEKPAPINPEGIQGPPDYKIYQGPETVYRTKNFIVRSGSGNAKMYAAALEYNRYKNAMEFLGRPIADWSSPCLVDIQLAGGNGGATTFAFTNGDFGKPFGWKMSIQGTPNGLLEDTIPHEVMHMVTAEAFQRMTPRWIDEGIATTTETETGGQAKLKNLLNQFMQQGRIKDFSSIMNKKEYPRDMLTIYAQGNSISNYLIEKGGGGIIGKRKLYEAFGYANQHGWPAALNKYYGFSGTGQFQSEWLQSLAVRVIAVLSKLMNLYPEINSIMVFI